MPENKLDKNKNLEVFQIQEAGTPVLVESKDDAGSIWDVVIIQSGKSANNNVYPPGVLEKAAPLFEGVRALSRSDEDHLRNKEKNVKNIVGWYEKVRFHEGALIGEFHISKAAEWLKTMLKDAWEQGKKDLVGFSIVAEGKGRLKKTSNGVIREVESIDSVSSVDVVVDPAAGGKILKLVAAKDAANHNMEDVEKMEKLLKFLESECPDLYKKIDPENITEDEIMELLAEAVKKPEPGEPSGTTQGNETLLADAQDLLAEAKKEREETGKKLKIAECKSLVVEKIAEAKLSPLVAGRVSTLLYGRIVTADEIDDAIKSEREYAAKLSESGRISGLGGSRVDIGLNEPGKLIEALDGFFFQENRNEVPRFKSFREAYSAITGDRDVTGLTKHAPGLQRFAEAMTSSSWAEILGDSITRRMIAEYSRPELSMWRKIVSDITSIPDFRSNKRMRMGGYGLLPAVSESGTYENLSSPGDEQATFAVGKYGGLETITMEMIANDDQGSIRRIPIKMARGAAITLFRYILDFIKDNSNVTYEAVALFHGDHSNLGSAALSATSLLAAKVAMADQAGYGASTDILGLVPRYLLIPSELEDLAFRLTSSPRSIGSAESTPRYADTEPNIHASYGLEPLVVPYWSDANDWSLVCNPSDCPTFEVGFLNGQEEPELFEQDQPTLGSVFTADKITYKIRHIYGATVLDHRGMYKAVVT